ncbi:thioesterase [Chryseotalea sanaruensis]|uniref:Thioesterase n=1 Tax=Chryseotalea sanaruensis TaxID=2482724 RepID=A0A401UCW3_9BACT|nr:thioesterase family protein [Chryseotalea sanaruensis]GCC52702.1 thioesterase [Chryseotalea sanaruensis]
MARLELTLPNQFIYTTELIVRVNDLNYGAHVGNDNMLVLMQQARINFYRENGFKDEVSFEGTVGQVISDTLVIYKAEAFLGDVLLIHLAIADVNKYGFDMLYQVINKVNGKEVARGKTGIVCFDYSKRKVAPIPARLLSLITAKID